MKNYIYILILLFLVSCKTYDVINYDVLRPALYSVPPEIKSVVLVDNSLLFNPDDAHWAVVNNDPIKLDTVEVDTFSTVVISALKKELMRRLFFDTVFVDTIKYKSDSNRMLQTLDQQQINSICSKFNADAVLSIAGVDYGTRIKAEDMGAEYFTIMEIKGTVYWRLYNGFTSELLYTKVQRDTLFWDGIGSDVNQSVSMFPAIKSATIELGDYLGASFADALVPYWEPVERRIYISGGAHFVNAAEWLGKDNRYEAEKLWGFIYEHGSDREKGRAANNIALSMEARGKLKEAMEWAYKSYQSYQTVGLLGEVEERRNAEKLYTDMVQRYREQKKLNEQIGGEL